MATRSQKSKASAAPANKEKAPATPTDKETTVATPADETTTNIPSAEKPATAKSSTPPLNAGEPPLDADTPPLDAYTDAPAVPLDTYDETPTGGRVPPQDLNAEKSLLGALLLSDASFPDVLELVRPADFYDQRHRQIYTAFVSLYDHHRPIDLLTVTSELKNNGTLKAVGGAPYLTDLTNFVPAATHAVGYAQLIQNCAIRRRLIQAGTEIAEQAYSPTNEVEELLGRAEKQLFDVSGAQTKTEYVALEDLLADAFTRIEELHKMGIKTYMLTGDNENTAKTVANAVGIDDISANVLPEDKLNIVKDLQKDENKVVFVGDGINDAPALTQADIGVAMGNGTDIAMESGDVVVMEGDLENVVAAIQFSKKVMTRIKQNIFWAFAYNSVLIPVAAGALFAAFGIMFRPELSGLAMALSSVTVISLSLALKGYVPPIKKSVPKKV